MTPAETIMHLADNFASLHRHLMLSEAIEARAALLAAVEAMALEALRNLPDVVGEPDLPPFTNAQYCAMLDNMNIAAPQPATGKQSLHVALTETEIDAIMQPLTQNVPYSWRAFARAIEDAHGIAPEAGK